MAVLLKETNQISREAESFPTSFCSASIYAHQHTAFFSPLPLLQLTVKALGFAPFPPHPLPPNGQKKVFLPPQATGRGRTSCPPPGRGERDPKNESLGPPHKERETHHHQQHGGVDRWAPGARRRMPVAGTPGILFASWISWGFPDCFLDVVFDGIWVYDLGNFTKIWSWWLFLGFPHLLVGGSVGNWQKPLFLFAIWWVWLIGGLLGGGFGKCWFFLGYSKSAFWYFWFRGIKN